MNEHEKKNEVATSLAKELIYRQHVISNKHLRLRVSELRVSEYVALQIISEKNGDKTYLKDLSARLKFSIRRTSKTVRVLRDKGLVKWEHEGDGTQGTYVLITKDGASLVRKQEAHIRDYYERVVEKFGETDMQKLLEMLRELDDVMDIELAQAEELDDDD